MNLSSLTRFSIKQIISSKIRVIPLILSITFAVGLLCSVLIFVDLNVILIMEEKIKDIEIDFIVYPRPEQNLDGIRSSLGNMSGILASGNYMSIFEEVVPKNETDNVFFSINVSDRFGNSIEILNGTEPFSLPNRHIIDENPAMVSNLTVSTFNSSAIISWETDEEALGKIIYGTSLEDYQLFPTRRGDLVDPYDPTMVMTRDHQIILPDLQTTTTYYFGIVTVDYVNNIGLSINGSTLSGFSIDNLTLETREIMEIIEEGYQPFSFTSESPVDPFLFPSISQPVLTPISVNTVHLSWDSNTSTNGIIRYGLEPSTLNETAVDSLYRLNHKFSLTGLFPNTTYHASIEGATKWGLNSSTPLFNFTTPLEDTSPPIITDVRFGIRFPIIAVSWSSNEPTNGTIWFGHKQDSLHQRKDSPSFRLHHSILVSPLQRSRSTVEIGGVDDNIIRLYNNSDYLVNGSFDISNDGVIISENLAHEYSFEVGDTLELSWVVYKQTPIASYPKELYNIFTVKGIAHVSDRRLGFERQKAEAEAVAYPPFDLVTNQPVDILINYKEAFRIHGEIEAYQDEGEDVGGRVPVLGSRYVFGWYDRRLLQGMDMVTAVYTLEVITNRVEAETDPVAAFTNLGVRLIQVQADVFFDRFFYIYFSGPALGLLCYATLYSAASSFNERQKEISLLKTRGISLWQFLFMVGMEITVVAALGIILGLVLGLVNGILMQAVVAFLIFDFSFVHTLFLPISWNIFWTSLWFALILSFLGIGIPALIQSIRMVTSLMSGLDDFISRYSRWFLIGGEIIVTLIGIRLVLFSQEYGGQIAAVNPYLELFVYLGPVLFVIGSVGIIGRLLPFIAGIITLIFQPILGDLVSLVRKQMTRQTAVYSSVMGVVLITIALGVLTSISAHSLAENRASDALYAVGADVVATPHPGFSLLKFDMDGFLNETSNMEGVEHVSVVYQGEISLGGLSRVSAIYVDPDTFIKAAYLQNFFVSSGNITKTLARLNTSSVIISSGLQSAYGFGMNEEIDISLLFGGVPGTSLGQSEIVRLPMKIIDFAGHFPTVKAVEVRSGPPLIYYFNIHEVSTQFVILSTDHLQPFNLQDIGIFMDVSEDVDAASLARHIENEYGQFVSVVTAAEKAREARLSKEVRSYFAILTLNFVFAILTTLIGTSIFVASLVRYRRREFGVLKAVGLSNRTLAAMVFGEVGMLGVVGGGLGLLLGTLMSAGLIQTISFSFLSPTGTAIELLDILLILILSSVCLTVGILLPLGNIFRTSVADVMAAD